MFKCSVGLYSTMKRYSAQCFFASVLTVWVSASNAQTTSEAIRLNNEGVRALEKVHSIKRPTAHDWEPIINKFRAAVKADPNYDLARQNLAIAYNNFAIFLTVHEHQPDKALLLFHQALYLNPDNITTEGDLNCLIERGFKKNPKSFECRVQMGDEARDKHDLVGAVVEYCAALKLKRDNEIAKKLRDVEDLLKRSESGEVR